MHSTRRATARTGKARQGTKRTHRKQSRLTRLEHEKTNSPRNESQPEHDYADTRISYLRGNHETPKLSWECGPEKGSEPSAQCPTFVLLSLPWASTLGRKRWTLNVWLRTSLFWIECKF